MNVIQYVAVGIGILVLVLMYGSLYVMTLEKKEKPGILFSIYEFLSKKIEFWKREKCVICGNPTAYTKKTPTIQRIGYTEAGQLCMNCNNNFYPRSAAEM